MTGLLFSPSDPYQSVPGDTGCHRSEATPAERKELVGLVLETVFVDVAAGCPTFVQPKAPYVALFRQVPGFRECDGARWRSSCASRGHVSRKVCNVNRGGLILRIGWLAGIIFLRKSRYVTKSVTNCDYPKKLRGLDDVAIAL